MYDEGILKNANITRIEDYLINNKKISFSTVDPNELRFIYAFEQYIIKYYKNPKSSKLKDAMSDRLTSLLQAFANNPCLMMSSSILHNIDFLKSVCNAEQKNLYIKGFNELQRDWKVTYNALLNGENVSSYDKARLETFFERFSTYKKDVSKEQKEVSECARKYFNEILKKKNVPASYFERKFAFSEANKFTLSQSRYYEPQFIVIGNEPANNGFLGGYYANDSNYIFINGLTCLRLDFHHYFYQMIQTLCHETTHAIQDREAIKNPNSVRSMQMAIQRLFGKNDYQVGDNYLFNEIEEDAQLNGYSQAAIIYDMAGIRDIQSSLIDEKVNYHKNRRFEYEYVTVKVNGKETKIPKEKYNYDNLTKVIKNNPSIIKKYPVLENLFHQDGSVKNTEELLGEKFVSHDVNKMYEDFLLYGIARGDLEKIDLSKKSEEEKARIISKVCNLFSTESFYVIDILKDYDFRNRNARNQSAVNRIKTLYNYHMKKIAIMGNFLNKELSWMREYEKMHPNAVFMYKHYQTYMNSLLNFIDKTSSNDQMGFLDKENSMYQSFYQETDKVFLDEYVKYILEHISPSKRQLPIYSNGREVSIEEFILNDVRERLTRNHYILLSDGSYASKEDGSYYHPVDFVIDAVERYQKNLDNGQTQGNGRK